MLESFEKFVCLIALIKIAIGLTTFFGIYFTSTLFPVSNLVKRTSPTISASYKSNSLRLNLPVGIPPKP